ncbi:MAG: HAD-IA family hydrolase, partial [Planctomycetia bacterium]
TQEIVAWLRRLKYQLGILSNTCDCHWEYCRRKFTWIDDHFDVHITSHQVGAMKPDPKIYRAAADQSGHPPEKILFIDDLLANVEGARHFGFDAIHYTDGPALESALRERVEK